MIYFLLLMYRIAGHFRKEYISRFSKILVKMHTKQIRGAFSSGEIFRYTVDIKSRSPIDS